jgi:hypothetical protein
MNEVFLWKANGRVINHADLQAAADLDGLTRNPDKTVTAAEWEAAGGRAFIDGGGNILLGIPAEEQARRDETAALEAEVAALLKELADKDYQVIRSAEQGMVLAELDPELHGRRQWCRGRIDAVRERLAELNAAA